MAIRLVVYDPPTPDFPHLAIVLESEPSPHIVHVEACASSLTAHSRLLRLAEILERDGVAGLSAAQP